MTQIIDGKKIASEIEAELKQKLTTLSITPRLAIVVINPDHRSKQYVELKLTKAAELGINADVHDWSGQDLESCLAKMKELASDTTVNGIIVQLPVPDFGIQKILDLIPLQKDVDGLSSVSLQAIRTGGELITPATPKAIIELLKRSGVDLGGKNILIVGQGKLVGEPLGIILKNKGLSVETADQATTDLNELCKSADVVISAAGKSGLIKAEMIKPGAVVIDAGISEVGGKMSGDVDYEGMSDVASKIAKVPGGVGPVTVICLLENLVEATKNSQ